MKKTKYIIAFVALIVVVNIIFPHLSVLAKAGYILTFGATGNHTLENDHGHLKIDGQVVDLVDSENQTIGELDVDGNTASITVGSEVAGYLNYDAKNMFTLYNTNGHTAYEANTQLNSDNVFLVEDYEENAEYKDIAIQYTFTGVNAEVVINDQRVTDDMINSWSGTVTKAGYTDSSKTNVITITTEFGGGKFSKITINNVDYEFTDNSDQHSIEVPGAESYVITASVDESIAQDRTIIWGNPGCTDINDDDDVLENGSARIIAVYDENGNIVDSENYTAPGQTYGVDEGGNGWVHIVPGSRVIFEFVPEYGYQLTKVLSNGMPLEAQETENQYEFIMPDTNVHFDAEFTKIEDVVKTNSDKVSNGTIKLGKNLNGGSVQLIVSNIELSADKIKEFQGAADGYTISNYLDIDLYNVFYKGKNDDEDVWSNKIDELDNEATISLKLAEGINANDIVIVHNIHDGEEYEIIQIDSYDPETNTITFKTKSFSNYAIATKENNTSIKASNPSTGDNIIMMISIFVLAGIGAFIMVIINKTRKDRK